MNKDIPAMIQKWPLSVYSRMRLERDYIMLAKRIKRRNDKNAYIPLVRQNRFYGHELNLKKYSGFRNNLWAIVEHGLFFGNNSARVGDQDGWELGAIITYGAYRKELINRCFPDYLCEMVGPMIHYAKKDLGFEAEIRKKINTCERTFLFFPMHGNEPYVPLYDFEKATKEVVDLAKSYNCRNLIICTYGINSEMFEHYSKMHGSTDLTMVVTQCGYRLSEDFLCKLKSLIEIADITASNHLGTLLGYCVYCGKPHVLIDQEYIYVGDKKEINKEFSSKTRSSNWAEDFKKETKIFAKAFSAGNLSITNEQRELCDYYWGFNQVKSKEQLYSTLINCSMYSTKVFDNRGK